MLELKKINKGYKTGDFVQQALKDVDLKFRKNEFVAILGPSGSGKTTLLNIVGGLDRYDSGDLIINGKSTKQFKGTEWDAYRNNCIGFIFQSYNLIGHISVLENVEMGMTLSGMSPAKRKKKALELLDKVGLKDHAHKRPNQLSGGQMQRVAIARALANDPDIILADEPTGALDTNTSVQIMELIREIAKDKLVIMVTHNPDLAKEYANRVVEFKDGSLISDTNPITDEKDNKEFKIKKTAMSFFTALKLSFNNIRTKKGRTFLTAFASSIGIIGIALILSLSNGFDIEIDKFEADTLSSFPVMITANAMDMTEEQFNDLHKEMHSKGTFPSDEKVHVTKTVVEQIQHENKISEEYQDYVEKIDGSLITGISYTRAVGMNILNKNDDKVVQVKTDKLGFTALPKSLEGTSQNFFDKNYDIISGTTPKSESDLILVIDGNNKIDENILKELGYDIENNEYVDFNKIIGKELKLVNNDNYYKQMGDYFTINTDLNNMYDIEDNITLKIIGIARIKEGIDYAVYQPGLFYTEALVNKVFDLNAESKIVNKQKEVDYNVLTGEKFNADTKEGKEEKETLLKYLGANKAPFVISIYPTDFDTKEKILDYLDEFNKGKDKADQIVYTDLAATFSSLSGNIMDAITIVLIAFSSISLVVSSIMIGIITYISVLERTKEIGILRALGARKKDITRVFNAETVIIGLFSGALGIGIARLLVIPANIIIENMSELPNVAKMNPLHAIALLAISVLLTLIGGAIPSRIASKKDPVEALRTE